ncbi:MAG: hypothetical protein SF339_25660 [Blastocatellia bacterium]|nr:hypothetical protein [Blastocatellia bacterium]
MLRLEPLTLQTLRVFLEREVEGQDPLHLDRHVAEPGRREDPLAGGGEGGGAQQRMSAEGDGVDHASLLGDRHLHGDRPARPRNARHGRIGRLLAMNGLSRENAFRDALRRLRLDLGNRLRRRFLLLRDRRRRRRIAALPTADDAAERAAAGPGRHPFDKRALRNNGPQLRREIRRKNLDGRLRRRRKLRLDRRRLRVRKRNRRRSRRRRRRRETRNEAVLLRQHRTEREDRPHAQPQHPDSVQKPRRDKDAPRPAALLLSCRFNKSIEHM